uniref:Uncharacterized protein n=2 Tax=Oryza TaxID=4527 RepID=A0A0E0IIS5_ORYNI
MACCWVDQLGIWEIGSMHSCVLCVCSKNVGSWACIKMRPLFAIGSIEQKNMRGVLEYSTKEKENMWSQMGTFCW